MNFFSSFSFNFITCLYLYFYQAHTTFLRQYFLKKKIKRKKTEAMVTDNIIDLLLKCLMDIS